MRTSTSRNHTIAVLGVAMTLAMSPGFAATVDFSGVWERYPPLHSPAPTPDAIFKEGIPQGPVPRLKEPYAAQYAAYEKKKDAAEASGMPLPDASVECLPMGTPGMMIAILPLEIMQKHREMLILAEELGEIRRVYIGDEMPPLGEIPPSYHGYSVAHWEGATLVVRTEGIREDVRYMDIPHSADMKVTERLRLTSTGMLEDQITIDDPAFLLEPFRFTFTYKKNPTYKVAEYVCDHNHYDVTGNGVKFDPEPKQ